MELNEKIFSALERIHTATRSALQSTVNQYGMSPLQAQILLYLYKHKSTNISKLAVYLKMSKPTISDAVKTLMNKQLLKKSSHSEDGRAFHLGLTAKGRNQAILVTNYAAPFLDSVGSQTQAEKSALWGALLHLINTMESQGLIPHNRMCFSCRYFVASASGKSHYCGLMERSLIVTDLRIDCSEHKPQAVS